MPRPKSRWNVTLIVKLRRGAGRRLVACSTSETEIKLSLRAFKRRRIYHLATVPPPLMIGMPNQAEYKVEVRHTHRE
jgi:hypothetical protein